MPAASPIIVLGGVALVAGVVGVGNSLRERKERRLEEVIMYNPLTLTTIPYSFLPTDDIHKEAQEEAERMRRNSDIAYEKAMERMREQEAENSNRHSSHSGDAVSLVGRVRENLFFEWLDSFLSRLRQLDDKLAPFMTSSHPKAIVLALACATGDFKLAVAFYINSCRGEPKATEGLGFASSQVSRAQLRLTSDHLNRLRTEEFSFEAREVSQSLQSNLLHFLEQTGPELRETTWEGWSNDDAERAERLLAAVGLHVFPCVYDSAKSDALRVKKSAHIHVEFLDPAKMQLEDASQQVHMEITKARKTRKNGGGKIAGKSVFDAWTTEEVKAVAIKRLCRGGREQLREHIPIKETFTFVGTPEWTAKPADGPSHVVISTFILTEGVEVLVDRAALATGHIERLGNFDHLVYRDSSGRDSWPGLSKAQNYGFDPWSQRWSTAQERKNLTKSGRKGALPELAPLSTPSRALAIDAAAKLRLALEAQELSVRLLDKKQMLGASVEHLCAMGGSLQTTQFMASFLDAKRYDDLDVLGYGEERDALAAKLVALILRTVPSGVEPVNGEKKANQERDLLRAEAEYFVPDYLDLQRGCHYLALKNARGERPADVAADTCTSELVLEGILTRTKSDRGQLQIQHLLSKRAKDRESELTDYVRYHEAYPDWWIPSVCLCSALLIALIFPCSLFFVSWLFEVLPTRVLIMLPQSLPIGLLSVLHYLTAALATLAALASLFNVVYFLERPKVTKTRSAFRPARTPPSASCARRLINRALARPRNFLRRAYIAFASEPAFGLPSPAGLQLVAVRARCDAQLQVWGMRMLAHRMRDHIKTRSITAGELMWLLEDLTAMANAAANEDDFFSDVEVVLPLSPADAEEFLGLEVTDDSSADLGKDAREYLPHAPPPTIKQVLEAGLSGLVEEEPAEKVQATIMFRKCPNPLVGLRKRSEKRVGKVAQSVSIHDDYDDSDDDENAEAQTKDTTVLTSSTDGRVPKVKGKWGVRVETALEEGGWQVVRSKRHVIIRRVATVNGKTVKQTRSLSATPSDWRGRRNVRSDLRKADRQLNMI